MGRKRQHSDIGPQLPIPLVHLQLNGSPGPLRVATDCSGMEAPLLTLGHKLRVNFVQVFGCDCLPAAQRLSRTHFQPVRYYNDIFERDNYRAESCHLYIAGYPCQPFSAAGSRLGLEDPRASVMAAGLHYIELKRPDVVIWENTAGLASERFSQVLVDAILILERFGYHVKFEIIDTQDHGLPQRRKRIYVVAIKTLRNELVFPEALPYCIPLSAIVTPLPPAKWRSLPPKSDTLRRSNVVHHYSKLADKGVPLFHEMVIVDADSSFGFSYSSVGTCMTLTNKRCASQGYWCSMRGGTLSLQQMAALQGIEHDWIDTEVAGISDYQFGAMIGNTMSVNVLSRLIPQALYAAGLATKEDVASMLLHSGWT